MLYHAALCKRSGQFEATWIEAMHRRESKLSKGETMKVDDVKDSSTRTTEMVHDEVPFEEQGASKDMTSGKDHGDTLEIKRRLESDKHSGALTDSIDLHHTTGSEQLNLPELPTLVLEKMIEDPLFGTPKTYEDRYSFPQGPDEMEIPPMMGEELDMVLDDLQPDVQLPLAQDTAQPASHDTSRPNAAAPIPSPGRGETTPKGDKPKVTKKRPRGEKKRGMEQPKRCNGSNLQEEPQEMVLGALEGQRETSSSLIPAQRKLIIDEQTKFTNTEIQQNMESAVDTLRQFEIPPITKKDTPARLFNMSGSRGLDKNLTLRRLWQRNCVTRKSDSDFEMGFDIRMSPVQRNENLEERSSLEEGRQGPSEDRPQEDIPQGMDINQQGPPSGQRGQPSPQRLPDPTENCEDTLKKEYTTFETLCPPSRNNKAQAANFFYDLLEKCQRGSLSACQHGDDIYISTDPKVLPTPSSSQDDL